MFAYCGNAPVNISSLFDFYDGEMISFKRYGPGSNSFKEGNIYSKEIFASYDVTTTKGVYRISILFCTVDTQTPGNVGILSLYIIRAENSDTDHAYWGDDSRSPGINIESSENTIQYDRLENIPGSFCFQGLFMISQTYFNFQKI